MRWVGLRFTRFLGYAWAAPNTAIGLLIGLVLAGRFRLVEGVIEIEGRWINKVLRNLWRPASAITLGHCVLGASPFALAKTRDHERVHVRQYEKWGPAFIPTYLAFSIWLYLAGRDEYLENPFERQAFAIANPEKDLAPRGCEDHPDLRSTSATAQRRWND